MTKRQMFDVIAGLWGPRSLAMAATLLTVVGSQALVTLAVQSPTSPLQVKHVSDLRARTPEDAAKARHFDREGFSFLDARHVTLVIDPPTPPVPPPPGFPVQEQPPDAELVRRTCDSDGVALGFALSRRVLLNKSETFLITDYQVAVQHWIRPLSGPRTISVTLLGGDVEVGGERMSATAGRPHDLSMLSVLFLKRIPNAGGGFALSAPQFRLDVDRVVETPHPWLTRGFRDGLSTASTIAIVRDSENRCGV